MQNTVKIQKAKEDLKYEKKLPASKINLEKVLYFLKNFCI